MRNACLIVLISLFSGTLFGANDPNDQSSIQVRGDYFEARTSDVWTGPCFANGEVNLVGREAVLAWSVGQGTWQGVDVSGLRVVAVLRASATLGDPFANQLPSKAVIIVDNRATMEQSDALVNMAKSFGGDLVQNVVWVKSAPISVELKRSTGLAWLKAGDLVELKTRALGHHDMHCGNETVYYPPLTQVAEATPAYALAHRFQGDGLGSTWSSPMKRSAFIGTFIH